MQCHVLSTSAVLLICARAVWMYLHSTTISMLLRTIIMVPYTCLYIHCCVQAGELEAGDPDYAIRDLYNAIASGDSPSWTAYLQVRCTAC
jgi:Catalase